MPYGSKTVTNQIAKSMQGGDEILTLSPLKTKKLKLVRNRKLMSIDSRRRRSLGIAALLDMDMFFYPHTG